MYVTRCKRCGKMHWAFSACPEPPQEVSNLIKRIDQMGGFLKDGATIKLYADINVALSAQQLREIADYLDSRNSDFQI